MRVGDSLTDSPYSWQDLNMMRSEDLEGRKAVGVVLDMADSMRRDDKEQMVLIAETYLSSATSQSE
jgi:hypothetical protein